jgi:hypothetical protein
MHDIDNFVWHLYINFILLNSVTRITAYPIPHCDLASNEEFGLGIFSGCLMPQWGTTNLLLL